MTDEHGETKRQSAIRNAIAGGITAVIIAAAAIGAPMVVNAANADHAQQVQAENAAKSASVVVKADGVRDTALAQSAIDADTIAKHEAAVKEQEAEAAAAAAQAAAEKAAQEAAAQQAARDAAAQQSQTQNASTSATNQSSAPTPSGQPSGTPLPMTLVTDPNNGHYGQYVPSVDPASWCANHSASTINGVPTCD